MITTSGLRRLSPSPQPSSILNSRSLIAMNGARQKRSSSIELPHYRPPRYKPAHKASDLRKRDSVSEGSALNPEVRKLEFLQSNPAKRAPIGRESLDRLSREARAALSAYSRVIAGSLESQLLPPLFVLREAVCSCWLEGACVQVEDVLRVEAGLLTPLPHPWYKQDTGKAQHCVQAIQATMERATEQPWGGDFAKDLHRRHFLDISDRPSSSHSFIKNWLIFPTAAHRQGEDFWQRHFSRPEEPDLLMRLAALCAEGDISPPFVRNSGYTLRMLVILSLYRHGLLAHPLFCLSEYLADHPEEYQDSLVIQARDGDGSHWRQFFLRGLRDQARRDQARAERIVELYRRKQYIAMQLPRSRFGQQILDAFFRRPIFSHKMLKEDTGLHWQSLDRFYRYCFIKSIIAPMHPPSDARPRKPKSPVYRVNGLMEAAFGDG